MPTETIQFTGERRPTACPPRWDPSDGEHSAYALVFAALLTLRAMRRFAGAKQAYAPSLAAKGIAVLRVDFKTPPSDHSEGDFAHATSLERRLNLVRAAYCTETRSATAMLIGTHRRRAISRRLADRGGQGRRNHRDPSDRARTRGLLQDHIEDIARRQGRGIACRLVRLRHAAIPRRRRRARN